MQSFEKNCVAWELENSFNNQALLRFSQLVGIGVAGILAVAFLLLLLNFLLVLCH